MKNVYIVRTPLQVLNALEAQYHFKTKNNVLIINARAGQVNKAQIETFLNPEDWDEIIWVDRYLGKSLFLQFIRIIHRFKREPIDRLFIGYFRDFKRIFTSNVKANEVYMLDDGSITLDIHKQLPQLLKRKMPLKERLRYNLFGLSTHVKSMPHWFTVYDLTPHKGQKLIPNTYEGLKSRYLNAFELDDHYVYFIGQNLRELKTLNEAIYFEAIDKVIQHFDKTIFYIPHRYESEEQLEKLQTRFGDALEVHHLHMAVEIFFLKNSIYPAAVISFFSAALFNLEKIFEKSEIYALYLPEEKLQRMQQEIAAYYLEMQRHTNITFLK